RIDEAGAGAGTGKFPAHLGNRLLLLYVGIAAASSVRLQKTWCVAKPSSDEATLFANLNYACSLVDCSVLQRRHACFDPNTLISHASIAMNLYYQAMGRHGWDCYFDNSALVVTTDPSESPTIVETDHVTRCEDQNCVAFFFFLQVLVAACMPEEWTEDFQCDPNIQVVYEC
ncbi:hypothetical protein BHE74_00020367, partial [Ensete ventricosum]